MKITKLLIIMFLTLSFSCSDDDGDSISARAIFTQDQDVDILDNTTAESSLDVTGTTVKNPSNVFFEFNISHTFVGDLVLEVEAPNGRIFTLLNDFGDSRNLVENQILTFNSTFTETLAFDDETNTVLSGDYAPSLSNDFTQEFTFETFLEDLPVSGTWTLRVIDEAGSDEGILHDWTILFEEDALQS